MRSKVKRTQTPSLHERFKTGKKQAPAELEKRKHKLKRLVQSPNSFFMKYGIGYSKLGSNIIF
jgi:hypothetical protein